VNFDLTIHDASTPEGMAAFLALGHGADTVPEHLVEWRCRSRPRLPALRVPRRTCGRGRPAGRRPRRRVARASNELEGVG
jgi:hypothetical protein